MDKDVKDCRVINGDRGVIISWTTACEALAAMRRRAKDGAYSGLMADDASFVRASMRELEKAVDDGEGKN